MIHHVPIEKSKTVIFWLEREVQYVYRLYKKKIQTPSMGKGGMGRQFFADFPDFFKKNFYFRYYIRDFFEKVQKVYKQSPPLSPLPRGGNLEFFLVQSKYTLSFMFKPKNHRIRFFNGYMMDHFLSLSLLKTAKHYLQNHITKCGSTEKGRENDPSCTH